MTEWDDFSCCREMMAVGEKKNIAAMEATSKQSIVCFT